MFLILALCADGILSAQATTRMAVRHIPPPGAVNGTHSVHGGARVNERAKISNDCNKIGSFEIRVGYATCGLRREKSSLPAIRKMTVRMVSSRV